MGYGDTYFHVGGGSFDLYERRAQGIERVQALQQNIFELLLVAQVTERDFFAFLFESSGDLRHVSIRERDCKSKEQEELTHCTQPVNLLLNSVYRCFEVGHGGLQFQDTNVGRVNLA